LPGLNRYDDLHINSAITDPPKVPAPGPEEKSLPDWVLVAVSKYIGRTEVEIMNIKDRTRVRLPGPVGAQMDFKIREVRQSRNFIEETVVVLQKGDEIGELTFDPKFLVLKTASAGTPAKAERNVQSAGKNSAPSSGERVPSKTSSIHQQGSGSVSWDHFIQLSVELKWNPDFSFRER
jgi:hypothetical protein